MSLDSKYNRIKEFNKLLIKFKTLKSEKPETHFKKERILKNVDELYEKYCNAYKNDYDKDDELNEVEEKKVDYKRFELFDKLNKKLTLDKEIKEIENREKNVDKKRFLKHFSYEPIALVNKLLDQNTQDLIN